MGAWSITLDPVFSGLAWLLIFGLVVSVPIIVWGSTVVLKLVDRFPIIIEIGASVLAWTAASMPTERPMSSSRE